MTAEFEIALEPLLRHRWNIAVLAQLSRSGGAKFITMSKRLGISRGSLTASLKHLVACGLVRRNSGYGHPLRPEYLLTGQGKVLARACAKLDDFVSGAAGAGVAYRKWSLPLVLVITDKQCRFNGLRETLDGMTPRALVLALKALEKIGWVVRQVDQGYPPTTTYALSKDGHKLLRLTQGLLQSESPPVSSS